MHEGPQRQSVREIEGATREHVNRLNSYNTHSPFHFAHPLPFVFLSPLRIYIMSEKIQEFLEVPQEFIREGNQVRHFALPLTRPFLMTSTVPRSMHKTLSKRSPRYAYCRTRATINAPFWRVEFVQISKAVAIGFAVMGFIGYLVKLIHIPM